MIELFKFISFLLTAAFGVYGSLVDFRRSDGRISLRGKIGISGVLASAALAACLQILQDRQATRDLARIVDANTEILSEMARISYSFNNITVDYLLEPDWELEPFDEVWREISNKFVDDRPSFGSASLALDDPGYITLANTLCYMTADLLFFKTHPIDELFAYSSSDQFGAHGEDLKIRLNNPCWTEQFFEPKPFQFTFEKAFDGLRRLSYPRTATVISTDTQNWRGNGNLISLSDLEGSQLLIVVTSSGMPVGSDFEELNRLRCSIFLRELVIGLPNGISLAFDTENVELFSAGRGYRAYEHLFLGDAAEIVSALYYDRTKQLFSSR
ncbi:MULTISPECIES: hypothetical protein [unclassified Yoonia]|uniref:hypothetical protein n=1 Tax=unclassified Yoonia TaxID=2629118 RepID=UPI002AFE9617|nr:MULTISPECIES: hypothetical protein [unclassified Yoonia]